MELKADFRVLGLIILACSAVFASAIFSQESVSPMAWRSFSIQLPEEVSAEPGQTITIDGGILNTGWWWMHDFSLTLSGLTEDYAYSFSPQYFETVHTIKEWDSDVGVYRVPEKFTLTITIPDNAAGLQLISVTGQEMQSAKQVTNSTQFVLKITPAEHFTVSDIIAPENVTDGEPFDMTLTVTNDGVKSSSVTLKVSTPADWTVAESSKSVTLDPNSSSEVTFTITPTITSGNITVTAEYPFKENITTISKIGPLLVPMPKPAETTTVATTIAAINVTEGVLTGYFSKLFTEVMGLPLWVIIVAAILLVIILWNLYKILGKYKFRLVRGKPEEMKKSNEVAAVEVKSETLPTNPV